MGNANASHKKYQPRPRQERKKHGLAQSRYGLKLKDSGRSVPLTNVETYKNDETVPLEAVFSFPISDDATNISDLHVVVEDKVIRSEVKEKDEAFNSYDDSIASGMGAYLLEKKENDKQNEFTLSVGNLPPTKEVKVVLTYVTLLEDSADDGSSMVFRLAANMLPAHDYSMKLKASVQMSHDVESVTCESGHELSIDADSGSMEWTNTDKQPLDEDMVIQVKIKDPQQPSLIVEQHATVDKNFAALLSFTPTWVGDDIIDLTAKYEFLFLVDRSGSMYGPKMQAAINSMTLLLHSLPLGSYFNVCSFGTTSTFLYDGFSRPYNDFTQRHAQVAIQAMQADMGGTELLAPLEHIFKHKGLLPLVIFVLTDGEVENTADVLKLVRLHNEEARVFAIGIGEECDKNLITGLARAGRGAAAFVEQESKLEDEVMKQLRLALRPRLLDATVNWGEGLADLGQTPEQSFTCRAGERLVVFKLFSLNEAPVKAEVEPSPKQVVVEDDGKKVDAEKKVEEKAPEAAKPADEPVEERKPDPEPHQPEDKTEEKNPDAEVSDSATKKKKKSTVDVKGEDSAASSKKKKSSANVDKGEADDSATKKRKKSTTDVKSDDVASGHKKGSSTDVKKTDDSAGKKKKTAPSLAVPSKGTDSPQKSPRKAKEAPKKKKTVTTNVVPIPFLSKLQLRGRSSVDKGDYDLGPENSEDKHKLNWEIENKGIITTKGTVLHSAIASALIRDLEKQEKMAKLKGDEASQKRAVEAIKKLGLTYQLASDHTSFVVVEERSEATVGEMKKDVIPSKADKKEEEKPVAQQICIGLAPPPRPIKYNDDDLSAIHVPSPAYKRPNFSRPAKPDYRFYEDKVKHQARRTKALRKKEAEKKKSAGPASRSGLMLDYVSFSSSATNKAEALSSAFDDDYSDSEEDANTVSSVSNALQSERKDNDSMELNIPADSIENSHIAGGGPPPPSPPPHASAAAAAVPAPEGIAGPSAPPAVKPAEQQAAPTPAAEPEDLRKIDLPSRSALASLADIASLQMSNGCWIIEHAANLVVVDVDKLKKAARELYDRKADSAAKIELVITAFTTTVILIVLETTYSKQSLRWGLLAAKAKLYLQGVASSQSVQVSTIRTAADKFVKANVKQPQQE